MGEVSFTLETVSVSFFSSNLVLVSGSAADEVAVVEVELELELDPN